MGEASKVKGVCSEDFKSVRELFEAHFEEDVSTGAALAVYLHGKPVIDLYGGHKDEAKTQLWEANTLVNVYSVTKAWTALCLHILKDRGLLDYTDTVAKHWEEFGAKGKEKITIRQAMSHQTGVQTLQVPVYRFEKLIDWNYMTGLIANQEVLWPPGSKAVYHAFTFGHINGEIVRRCDSKSRTVGQFFREEVAVPLGLEDDMYIGLDKSRSDELSPRCAEVFCGETEEVYLFNGTESEFDETVTSLLRQGDDASIYRATQLNPQRPSSFANKWQFAELPASGGYTNARALAKLYSVLLEENPKVVKKATLKAATTQWWTTAESKFAGGFMLKPLGDLTPNGFGHSGLGGHLSFADPDRGLSLGYTMNKCMASKHWPGIDLAKEVYACLDKARHAQGE